MKLNPKTGLIKGLGLASPIIDWRNGGKQDIGPYPLIWKAKRPMPDEVEEWVAENLNENFLIDPGTMCGTKDPAYETWAEKNEGKGKYEKPVYRPGQ